MGTQFSIQFPLQQWIIDSNTYKIRTNKYEKFSVYSNCAWFLNFPQNILHRIVDQDKKLLKIKLIYLKSNRQYTKPNIFQKSSKNRWNSTFVKIY